MSTVCEFEPLNIPRAEGNVEDYRFIDEERAIEVRRYDLPAPWINYLSNGNMHAFVSQAGGGCCWWKSPLLFRLNRYRMHHLPTDSPGFYIYLREEDGSVWSPTHRPTAPAPDEWTATHKPGHTIFTASRGGLKATLTLFMAQEQDALVWDLRIQNTSGTAKKVEVFAYTELSQLDWVAEQMYGYYLKHKVKTWYDTKNGALLYLYHHEDHPRLEDIPLVYFAASLPADRFSGDRDAFMGPYRDERLPLSVEKGFLGNDVLHSGEPCAALQHGIEIEASGELRLSYFLGVSAGAIADYEKSYQTLGSTLKSLRGEGAVDREFALLEKWWDRHLGAFHCEIPDKTAQRQITTWNPVNSVHAGRYSRAVNIYAPGGRGIGFRDSCQDMLAIAYRDPAWAQRMFEYLLTLQFQEGKTLHVAHPEEKDPPDVKTRSDNHLWLPLLAHALAAETGDISFLDKTVPYFDGGSGTVWSHLCAAVRFTESHLGRHLLPLTLHGDWNDIIGKFSRKGKGESVFAGQQYVYALRLLMALAGRKKDQAILEWLSDCRRRQEQALLDHAWDGKWWRRAFDDEGNTVGGQENVFGNLFLNPQSWAVLSGVGSRDQLEKGMREVSDQLDTGIGLKLLHPGFKTWPEVKDPFSGYGPGTGENGAIFCHANTWAVIAEALLGHGERAWKYFTQIIPQNVINRVGLERYASEPYAWVSNIVGPENPRFGWGNISHVTGTAAWMDVAASAYLLGVRAELDGLRIDPAIPGAWEQFSVTRRYAGSEVHLRIENPENVESGVVSLKVEGQEIRSEGVPVIPRQLLEGRRRVEVQVRMG